VEYSEWDMSVWTEFRCSEYVLKADFCEEGNGYCWFRKSKVSNNYQMIKEDASTNAVKICTSRKDILHDCLNLSTFVTKQQRAIS